MSTTVEQRTATSPREEVAAGWRTVAPVCLSVLPLGLALGVLTVQVGLAWWWAPVLAAVAFAGSLEFLLLGMLAAAAPFGQIAATTVAVNFRHVFYALSFPLHRVPGRGWKAYSTLALTDEAFALTATPEAAGWSRARIISIQAFFHLAWVLSVAIGAVAGTAVPPQVVGLEFAVTALFTVLAIEAWRVQRSVPAPVLALVSACVATLIAPDDMLLVAMGLFTGGLVLAHLLTRGGHRA